MKNMLFSWSQVTFRQYCQEADSSSYFHWRWQLNPALRATGKSHSNLREVAFKESAKSAGAGGSPNRTLSCEKYLVMASLQPITQYSSFGVGLSLVPFWKKIFQVSQSIHISVDVDTSSCWELKKKKWHYSSPVKKILGFLPLIAHCI